MLRSDLCGYSETYIAAKIFVTGTADNNKRNKKLNFKNNVPFKSYI